MAKLRNLFVGTVLKSSFFYWQSEFFSETITFCDTFSLACPAAVPGTFLQKLKSVLKFLHHVNKNDLRFDLHIVELILKNTGMLDKQQELQSQENVSALQSHPWNPNGRHSSMWIKSLIFQGWSPGFLGFIYK